MRVCTAITLVGFAAVLILAVATGAVADGVPDKRGNEAKTESVRGIIQGVDNNQVRIKRDGATTLAVKLDSQTKITVDGKEAGLTDLKAGQSVSCTYVRRVGVNLGLAIEARSAKK